MFVYSVCGVLTRSAVQLLESAEKDDLKVFEVNPKGAASDDEDEVQIIDKHEQPTKGVSEPLANIVEVLEALLECVDPEEEVCLCVWPLCVSVLLTLCVSAAPEEGRQGRKEGQAGQAD